MHANWRLEEHHSRLLTMAAEAWDRACQAREISPRMVSFLVAARVAAGHIPPLLSNVTCA